MFCGNCGRPITDNSVQCSYCGKKFDFYKQQSSNIKYQNINDIRSLMQFSISKILFGIGFGISIIMTILTFLPWGASYLVEDSIYFWTIANNGMFLLVGILGILVLLVGLDNCLKNSGTYAGSLIFFSLIFLVSSIGMIIYLDYSANESEIAFLYSTTSVVYIESLLSIFNIILGVIVHIFFKIEKSN